jgi:cytochrome c-type biogenesis protein CcsB
MNFMKTLETFLFYSTFLGYLVSCALYLGYGATRRERFSHVAHAVLVAAVLSHFWSLASRTVLAHSLPDHAWYVPWSNWFESFSFFAFLIAAVFLAVQSRTPLPILGAFVMPWVCLALAVSFLQVPFTTPGWSYTGFGDLCALAASARSIPLAKPALQSVWMALHVPLIFASYAAFANAFAVGLAYFIQERQIKSRKPGALCYRLPALEDLDRLIFCLIAAAFPLLTLGLVLGAFWAHGAWGRAWGWDAKEIWALATWLIYLVYLHMRVVAGWRGRRTAALSLVGFAMVIFTYVGVNSFSRLHGFLSAALR